MHLERTQTTIISKKMRNICRLLNNNLDALAGNLQILSTAQPKDCSMKEPKAVIDKRDAAMIHLHDLLGKFSFDAMNIILHEEDC